MIELTDEQAEYIISHKDIPEDITGSAENVAVVLSQNWCPQWVQMKSWLPSLEDDIRIYYQCYNIKPYSYKLMKVKEAYFGNDLIPYVRYYKNGMLVSESNYVDIETFRNYFKSPVSFEKSC